MGFLAWLSIFQPSTTSPSVRKAGTDAELFVVEDIVLQEMDELALLHAAVDADAAPRQLGLEP